MKRRTTRWHLPVSLAAAVSTFGVVAGATIFLGQGTTGSPVPRASQSSAARASRTSDHAVEPIDRIRPPKSLPAPRRFVAVEMAAPLTLARHAIRVADPGFDQFTRLRNTDVADAASPEAVHRMFNARSCAECHRQGGIGGGGPNENNVRLISKAQTSHDPKLAAHFGPGFGVAVVHRQSLAPEYGEWRLALIEKLAPHDPEVVERIKLRLQNAAPGTERAAGLFCCSLAPPPSFEQRNTPPLFGLGRIETIPQSAIDTVAASQPKEIRGRSPRLQGGGHGRFGWKSSTATLAAFNENACAVELGLSTPRFTPAKFRPALFRSASNAPIDPPQAPAGSPAPDMSDADLAALNRFVADLPAPRQFINPVRREQVAEGAGHFRAIGCAVCHRPNLGKVTGLYSDLLLHSVGTSGGGFYGGPSPTQSEKPLDFDIVRPDEFRTPPLWGAADSGPYLHDGSAATLEAAIARHHGQASSSSTAFHQRLTIHERASLIAFLETLRAP
jgi:CxxC motif-containing protein (DUF1111 family)